MNNNKQNITNIQIIRRNCCNTIFAACVEPLCYTEKDWTKSLKEYVIKGCKVEYVDARKGLQLQECICNKKQLKLM